MPHSTRSFYVVQTNAWATGANKCRRHVIVFNLNVRSMRNKKTYLIIYLVSNCRSAAKSMLIHFTRKKIIRRVRSAAAKCLSIREPERWPRHRVASRDFLFAGIVGLSGVAPVMVARHAGYPRSPWGPGVIHRECAQHSDGGAGRGRSAAARCRSTRVPFLSSVASSRDLLRATRSARSHLRICAGSGAALPSTGSALQTGSLLDDLRADHLSGLVFINSTN